MVHCLISLPVNRKNFDRETSTIKTLACLNAIQLNIDREIQRKRAVQALASCSALSPVPVDLSAVPRPHLIPSGFDPQEPRLPLILLLIGQPNISLALPRISCGTWKNFEPAEDMKHNLHFFTPS